MKTLLLAVAAALVAAPAAAAPARPAKTTPTRVDWTRTVTPTAVGFVMGNPNAKVLLIEYGSYTCPHCAVFQTEGLAALKSRYIAPGKVRFEFRSFVRNGPDYAASLLAMCEPQRAAARTEALFAGQTKWIEGFSNLTDEDAARLQKVPKDAQIAELSKVGGLTAYVTGMGLPANAASRCLADKTAADKLTTTLKTAIEVYKVAGTPTFLINGAMQTKDFAGIVRGVTTWADLEPMLAKALR